MICLNKIEVKYDLSKYTKKSDLKNAADVNTSQFAKQDNLANIKSEVRKLLFDKLEKVPSSLNSFKRKIDKSGNDKLKPVPVDLKKLSDAVDDVGKKTVYDELYKKVNAIDTSDLVKKLTTTQKVMKLKIK